METAGKFILWVICGAIGGFIGTKKGRPTAGYAWGLLLGPIGWLVVGFGPDLRPPGARPVSPMKTSTKVGLGCLAVAGFVALCFVVALIPSGAPESSARQAASPSALPPAPSRPVPSPAVVGDSSREIFLSQALLNLRLQGGSLNDLKGCAYKGDPNFVVDSTPNEWVIYKYDPGPEMEDFEFAVERQSGEYYGSGQRMSPNYYYEITGTEDFETVMGQTKMVPVGRLADPDLHHCQKN